MPGALHHAWSFKSMPGSRKIYAWNSKPTPGLLDPCLFLQIYTWGFKSMPGVTAKLHKLFLPLLQKKRWNLGPAQRKR